MRTIHNSLSEEEFNKVQNLLMGLQFPWFYRPIVDYQDDENKFQFCHYFYNDQEPKSTFLEELNPILDLIKPTALIRIKANLLTKTPEIIENTFHHDISDYDDENRKTIYPEKLKQLTTAIFYVNTNNGYTEFEDGTKVESIANRMITFPTNMKHLGTSCTDEKVRIVINFNYFK
jgi:hypothetical protein